MADIVIDASCYTAIQYRALRSGPFWVSTLIGYAIFEDASLLSYSKTTDGGATWGAAVDISSNDAYQYDCWADWQTPGDSGTLIHIAYVDTDGALLYRSLDTSTDTLGTEKTIVDVGTIHTGGERSEYHCSITKTRGGNLAIAARIKESDNSQNYLFYTSIDAGANWVSKNDPFESTTDYIVLFPANLADANDLWGLYWDRSANDVMLKTFDDDGNSWGEATIDANVGDTGTFIQMAGAVRHSDGHLIVAVWSAYDEAGSDLRTWDVTDGGTITAKTNVISNTAEYFCVGVFIDQSTDDIYVCYFGGTAALSEVDALYQKSTDGGGTWDGQVTLSDDAEEDYRYISVGAVMESGGGFFMPMWFDDDDNDMLSNKANAVAIEAGFIPMVIVI